MSGATGAGATGRGPAITCEAPDGVPEIAPGDDLAAHLLAVCAPADGDIVVVTSKVVSKAEGLVRRGDRDDFLAAETARVVARRGPTRIVRTHHGLTMAAAGIDASNVARGRLLLLPRDPDASARRLRTEIRERTGARVGVIVSDTAGRAWRAGQTDIAIGAAGLLVTEEFAGRTDAHGNDLVVTAPAVADELAGAAELASGKLGGRPFVLVRGRADLVLPADEDGPGARALVRAEGEDLFGLGAREAVVRALVGADRDRIAFGVPVPAVDLLAALEEACGLSGHVEAGAVTLDRVPVGSTTAVHALAFAHGWTAAAGSGGSAAHGRVRLVPATP